MANAIYNSLLTRLNEYKSKYYKNMLLKGSILTIGSLLTAFTLINILEYFGNFNNLLRAVLFFSFLAISLGSLCFWILIPLLKLFNLNKPLSNHEAAVQIGRHFPEIDDKLLNVLQLGTIQSGQSELLRASIEQKSANLTLVNFVDAVRYERNKKYLRFLLPPLFIAGVIILFLPQLFTETTPRILQYDKTFEVQAPFKFKLANQELKVFKGEDFELQLQLEGSAFPAQVHLLSSNGRNLRMEPGKQKGNFTYLFKNVQKEITFNFEASGFSSPAYTVQVIERPNLSNFSAYLSYPAYIGKKDEKLENTGNMIVPEGTSIRWVFKAQQTDLLTVQFDSVMHTASGADDNAFEFKKQIFKSASYKVQLKNKFSTNKEAIEYYLNVIPDEYPVINIKQYEDTTLYNYLMIGGNIADDYGIQRLEFKYRVIPAGQQAEGNYSSTPLRHNPSLISQSYFYQLDMASFNLKPGDKLEYFVQVWDNDGIKGSKSSKTTTYEFRVPDAQELREEIAKDASSAENQMEKALDKAKQVQQELKEIEDKLKSKKTLTWQDKKAIEELLRKKEELVKDIEKLQQQNQMLNEKQQRFNEQDEKVAEKSQQLQKLMDELLDEETRRLYEELNKLLQQEMMNNNMQDLLNKLNKKEMNLEKELDRALEMFKKLQFEKKAKETAEQLDQLSKEQEKLAEETKDPRNSHEDKDDKNAGDKQSKDEKNKELEQKQEKLNQEFKEIEKALDELEKMNESMEEKQDMQNLEQQEKGVEKSQQESKDALQKNQNKKASQSQKDAAEKMQEMAQQMQEMQQSGESSEAMENYDDLRKILENLVKLSFDQEDVMKQFREVRQEDPRFIALGQRQLKLKDDAKIIEDSLMALAKRVFQIESFVTREVTAMNDYINQSLDEIKKRNVAVAVGKQQFTMTSINNLALMLNDVLEQMQQSLGQQMSGKQMSNKPGGKPQLSDLQKSLNQRVQDLQKSGKSGRALSEELAKLAAEQEAIRKAMKGMQGQGGKEGQKPGQKEGKQGKQGDGGEEGGGGNLGKMLDEMEKTEEDLVNKRLTEETLKRQKEILTRLLESEKAMRERELDEKREAQKGKEIPRTVPSEFSDYLKVKEKQVELLKTIPASLNPYYKQKVNEYFKKINE